MIKFALIVFFITIMVFSGIFSYFKTKTVDDFVLGNRDIGPWFSAFAYSTTYFSAVLFIGYAGKIGFTYGLSGLWIALGNAIIGSYLAWKVLAKKTRFLTEKLNARTMPEFLAYRYNLPIYKPLSALIVFIFLVPYSASVYMGLSYFFEAVFNINYKHALYMMAILTTIYLMLGGYHAVTLTDFIQGLIMIFGVVVMVYFIVNSDPVGGFFSFFHKLESRNPRLVNLFDFSNLLPIIFLTILTSFGTWGLPQMVQKFYAIKDEKAITPATIVSTIFCLVISSGAYFTGSLTPLFFDNLPIDPVTKRANADLLIPQILSSYLPEWASVLIFLLVLSASMSTLSSLVLVSSSSVAIDLFGDYNYFKKDSRQVIALRILSLIFILLSIIIAINKPVIILTLMAISWGAVSGSFMAPYILGLYKDDVSGKSAIIGTIVGLSSSILLAIYFKFDAKYIPITSTISILLPFFVIPLVNYIFKSQNK
ncbi:MAG: sodium:solute symporter [Proteobacteria bacterium]|nr:sodium:solute symporter [Pseudomonadota bacterium]